MAPISVCYADPVSVHISSKKEHDYFSLDHCPSIVNEINKATELQIYDTKAAFTGAMGQTCWG